MSDRADRDSRTLEIGRFDLVCHQRLTAKLAERVSDRRLLVLIGRMLEAKVVLPDGVIVINTEQGVPQGGPLTAPTQVRTSSLSDRLSVG